MKFNNKNNAVHLLNEHGPCRVEIDTNSSELPTATFFIDFEFPIFRPLFRKSVRFLCKPFFDAYLKARDKLTAVLQKEGIRKSGTLIYSVDGGFNLTTFYTVETKPNGAEVIVNGRIAIFANGSDNPLPRLIFYTHIKDSQTATCLPLSGAVNDLGVQEIINDVFGLLVFIKYCPVETKILARGKKVSHSNEEYHNKTDLPIEILDSTWFTTIVRSEGFSVSGHFRLQPIGPGLSERKLIWIAPYEKTGYVRKAGVLRSGDMP